MRNNIRYGVPHYALRAEFREPNVESFIYPSSYEGGKKSVNMIDVSKCELESIENYGDTTYFYFLYPAKLFMPMLDNEYKKEEGLTRINKVRIKITMLYGESVFKPEFDPGPIISVDADLIRGKEKVISTVSFCYFTPKAYLNGWIKELVDVAA